MPIIFGIIRADSSAPALGAIVRAFDKDLRHEQLLGEAVITETTGRYEITYTADQFRRAEKKSADLIVRAFDREGNLRTASEIRFNASDNERIDLTFGPVPIVDSPRLSELEQLQQSIDPLLEGIAYHEFTDQDLVHLTEEIIRAGRIGVLERQTIRRHLGFLRLADQFARQTDIPLAAFYGWFRQDQPQVLNTLLDVLVRSLRAALVAAIRGNIIPDITAQLSEILERIGSVRFEQGRLVNHRFVVRLVDAATGRPLAGYAVEVSDPAAEPESRERSTLFTDGRGICVIIFSLPGDAAANATRRLQLRIADDGIEVAEVTLDARVNQEEVATIRVRLREPESGNAPIEESAPPALAARLRRQGIRTLDDVLAHPELVDNEDPEDFERLRATAKFTVLAPEMDAVHRSHLLNRGFRRLPDIAAISRAEFIRDNRAGLGGDAAAYATHFAAKETSKVLHHLIGSTWINNVTQPDDEPPDPDIPSGVNEILNSFKKCGCKDCSSAISPAAYLAHLLEWTLEHIKDGTASISFSQLQEEFHQPFSDLPATCSAVEEQVRQVRICVETLWRYTGLLDRTDLQLPASFRSAYRQLRNQLYRGILTHLGTSFEQLRQATIQIQGNDSIAGQIAIQRRVVAELLGIDEAHLNALLFNIEHSAGSPSEDQLQQLFGFKSTRTADVFAPIRTPDLVTWQRERLEAIWQQLDWPSDVYSGESRLPFVDPVLIDESYLRTPLTENTAFPLLQARREVLLEHRQAMITQSTLPAGLAGLLESGLGQSIEQLQNLYATLLAGEQSEDIIQAQETIHLLHLTPAGFTYLMDLHAREVAGEPIGANIQAIEAAWETAFDILSGVARRRFFSTWANEENDLGLIFGSKLFWLPVMPSSPVNPWQAALTDRTEWQAALARRSARPIIDPDQISTDYIIVFRVFIDPNAQSDELTQPPLRPITLWHQRREWIDGRLTAMQAARQNQPNPMATLEAALSASNSGIGLDVLAELANLEAAGGDLEPHLAQFNLTSAEYRFLAEIHLLAQGNTSVSSTAWQEVDAILVGCEKRLECAEWRIAEQAAGIILHPHRFVLPKNTKPIDDTPQAHWLHNAIALQQWGDTLQARSDQLKALKEGLAQAVSNAEEAVLPLLRNILIMQTVANGDSLLEKAEWLNKRLLLDTQMSGCQMTTRVSQVIETLQRFIRGVYTQEHPPLMQHLTLDAEEDYLSEWPVLGSYASWRAFMLAYLFPENLLHLSPPSRQSYGFSQLKKKLPSRVDPKDACAAAEAYSNYFQDVFNLEVQASCQVRTRVNRDENCGANTSATISLLHVFALATTSGKVYSNSFESDFDSKDTLGSWQPVPQLNDVVEIIGAVPYETPTRQRLILLFVKVREISKHSLKFVEFDLDTNAWSKTKPKELDLPPGAETDFSAVAVQKRHGSVGTTLGIPATENTLSNNLPTILGIRVPDGAIYVHSLNARATSSWNEDIWIPLFGKLLAQRYKRLCALIQRTRHEYMMIVQHENNDLHYRIFSVESIISRDDGFWRTIAKGNFSGAFMWPGTPDIFVFYEINGKTHYVAIGVTAELLEGGDFISSVEKLEGWLTRVPGVSLANFHIELSYYDINYVTVEDPGILIGYIYKGNLLNLLTLTATAWDYSVPEVIVNTKKEILAKAQQAGLERFAKAIQNLEQADFSDALGQWRLADWYVRQFASGKSLLSAVQDSFDSEADATVFRFRAYEERSYIESPVNSWVIVYSGGDEEFGANPQKAIALRLPNGVFRLKLKRSGDVLSAPKLSRITPVGDGPFALTPLVDKNDLQLRRSEIREMYMSNMMSGFQTSIQMYLIEAFNLIPTYLGYQLQRNGHFEEALLWYRQVYDYLQSDDKRKIDYGLRLEQAFNQDYEQAEEWLNDANNAHAIAATRKNTYTRHILLRIIRCLIEYADSLFSHDNATDNARARELYAQALKLLEAKELRSAKSSCVNILGQLEIEVVEPGQVPLQQFQAALAQLPDPDHLNAVIASLRVISQNSSRPVIDRLTDMRQTVLAAVNEIPAAPRMMGILATKRQTVTILENQFLTAQPSRTLLTKAHQHRRQVALVNLAEVTDSREEELLETTHQLPWLREARFEESSDDPNNHLNLAILDPRATGRLAALSEIKNKLPMVSLAAIHNSSFAFSTGITFDFCIPQNPVIQALRIGAENNLTKLRTCRNIAGMLRQTDPYGTPIGIGSGLVSPDGSIFNGIVDAPPTAYRYIALISRAKELVGISQQIEASYQTALENAEREALTLMQAEQSVELAGARVALQDLRVTQANNELGLVQLQKNSAVLREDEFASRIANGLNVHEQAMLNAYTQSRDAQIGATMMRATAQIAAMTANIAQADLRKILRIGIYAAAQATYASAVAEEAAFQSWAITQQARAQSEGFLASYERQFDDWRLQQGLAAMDKQIGDQQIVLAKNQIDVVQQERFIAGLEQTHAIDMLNFLLGKSFTEEMYRWIASVLEDVYRFFLQEATVIARLAERQLAFERQQAPLKVIQSDYWNIPSDTSDLSARSNDDRLGLTGSARLLQDIFRLDNYAFESRQRKQSLFLTLDLAAMFPVEFQRFRETGVLVFNTPQSLIDQQMPGYYLCLIQQVNVSIVALIPTTYGIRATLTSAGTSRTVVGGDTFQTIVVRNLPERMALTSASTSSTSVIELQPDNQSLLIPFEGSGFDTLWELRMPKAANPFDYNSMATVLFTVNLSALHSFDYEREVIQKLDRKHSFDRAFDFRQVFSDAWYDLNNPDLTDTPMVVRFDTRRSDFPPNLTNLTIQHVVLYLVREDGEVFEQPIRYLQFTAEEVSGAVGGSAVTVSGRVSTRSGNGANWLPMIGLSPIGQWELAFPDDNETRNRFTNEEVQNILLVITISGKTFPFPS